MKIESEICGEDSNSRISGSFQYILDADEYYLVLTYIWLVWYDMRYYGMMDYTILYQ